MQNKITSYAALITTAVLWGGGFVCMELSLRFTSPQTLVFLRFLFTLVIFGITGFKSIVKADIKTVLKGLLLGVFFSAGFLFQTFGMSGTTASKTAFITGLNMVFVPFIFWIIKKKRPPARSFAAVAVCTLGLSLLTLDLSAGALSINMFDLLVLISALAFGLHIAFTGYFLESSDLGALVFFQYFSCSIISGAVMAVSGGFRAEYTGTNVLSLLYLVIFATALTSFLQAFGQKKANPDAAALILSLESVFGAVSAAVFLGDSLTLPMIAGSAAIMAGILISQLDIKTLLKNRRHKNEI